jgi:hypothetical protein
MVLFLQRGRAVMAAAIREMMMRGMRRVGGCLDFDLVVAEVALPFLVVGVFLVGGRGVVAASFNEDFLPFVVVLVVMVVVEVDLGVLEADAFLVVVGFCKA